MAHIIGGQAAPPLMAAVSRAAPSLVCLPKPRSALANMRANIGPSKKKRSIMVTWGVVPEYLIATADKETAPAKKKRRRYLALIQ